MVMLRTLTIVRETITMVLRDIITTIIRITTTIGAVHTSQCVDHPLIIKVGWVQAQRQVAPLSALAQTVLSERGLVAP